MSPDPWNDARSRIEAAAFLDPSRISWPNELFQAPAEGLWIVVDADGDILAPRELGPRAVWVENGRISFHILTPRGLGSDDARVLAKTIANAFRGLPPSPMTYYDAAIETGQPDDPDGRWWRLTVSIEWRYQDVPT